MNFISQHIEIVEKFCHLRLYHMGMVGLFRLDKFGDVGCCHLCNVHSCFKCCQCLEGKAENYF